MVARAGRPLYPVLSSPNMHRDPKPRKKGQDRQIPETEAANLFRCAVDSPRQRTNWGKKKAPLRDRTGSTPQLLLSDWGRVKTLSWTWFVGWALSDGRTDGIASHPYWRRGSSATLLLHTVCTETSPHREATLGEKTWAPASPHSHGLLLIFFLFSSGLHSRRRGSEERGHRVCSGQDESRFKLTIKGLEDPLLPQVFRDHHPQVSCLLASLNKLLLLLLLVPITIPHHLIPSRFPSPRFDKQKSPRCCTVTPGFWGSSILVLHL